MECRICGNSENNPIYKVREMMFGFKDEFEYFQCSKCNCLQISQVPQNMSKYYPDNYYSFSSFSKTASIIKMFFKKIRNNYLLFNEGILGKWINRKYPAGNYLFDHINLLQKCILHKKSRILDVGCGAGQLLYNLSISNLMSLSGIDPFIENDITYNNNLKILKRDISEVEGEWDIIMFHHSFEHVPNPIETMQSVSKLLAEGGVCLLRIPVVSSFAWEHYREDWVQLDAPRHFFLHSIESISILAKMVNLNLNDIIYDSTAFQFWGSEQYKRDISLKSNNSFSINPSNSIFSEADINNFSEKAKKFNQQRKGDQAAFYLIKNK